MNMATKAHIIIFTFNYWCIHSVFKHVIVFLCLEQFQKCSCPLRSIEIYMVFTLPAQ